MSFSQSELVSIGNEHFHTIILPCLSRISKEAVDSMMVFIEGSALYGFCDSFSDVDIDYYINIALSDETKRLITSVFNEQTYYHKSIRVSYGFSGKYWKFNKLINGGIDSFWAEANPYALYNIKHAVPVWDQSSLLEICKERTAFYPPDILKKHIRGLWLTMRQRKYNLAESLSGKTTEGLIYFGRALEHHCIIYLLNGEYYPPSKWLTAGLRSSSNFRISRFSMKYKTQNSDEKYQCFMKYWT